MHYPSSYVRSTDQGINQTKYINIKEGPKSNAGYAIETP